MWSDHISVKQQVPWGIYINELSTEAERVEDGTPCVSLIASFGVIRVNGEESATFLQGQVTCDINKLQPGDAVLGAHCNAKGRAQASFICSRIDDDYLLLLPSDQVDPTVQALGKFAMFSKAEVSACSDFEVFAVLGDQATLQEALSAAAGATLFHLPHVGVLGLTTSGAAVINTAQELNVPIVGDNAWMLSQINAGVVHISAAQSEQWIPQEINYDLIEGVNFKKGCYKGQEIVARIHYRGQTKVRIYPLLIEGVECVEVGDKVLSNGYQGTILSFARVSEHKLKVLAIIKTEAAESQLLKLDQNESAQIRVLTLPYAIT